MPLHVAIVGAGIHGLAAAWALRRRRHRVTLFEQGPIPNPGAASVDRHRVIRAAYGALEEYARLIPEAHAAWERLWRDLGRSFYRETGVLVLSDAASDWARRSAAALERMGRRIDWLDGAQVARRFPLIRHGGIDHAFELPDGGVLLADAILTALAERLGAEGAALRPNTKVTALDAERGELRLASGESFAADALLIAAGAWVGKLVPALASRVVASRQAVFYMDPPSAALAAWSRSPVLIEIRREGGFYLVPPVAGTGLKLGDHSFSRAGDPDAPRRAEAGDDTAIRRYCAERLAGFDAWRLRESKICFYAVTADERFVLEPLASRTVVLSACSGHGFKFGALMGERAAAEIERMAG